MKAFGWAATVLVGLAGCSARQTLVLDRASLARIEDGGAVPLRSEHGSASGRVRSVAPQSAGGVLDPPSYRFGGLLGTDAAFSTVRTRWDSTPNWQRADVAVEVPAPGQPGWILGGTAVGLAAGYLVGSLLITCEPGDGRSCEDFATARTFLLGFVAVPLGGLVGGLGGQAAYRAVAEPTYRIDAR